MIVKANINDVEKITKYIFSFKDKKEFLYPICPKEKDYTWIFNHVNKMIDTNKLVLVDYLNDQINAVLIVFVDDDQKYLQTEGGIFTNDCFDKVADSYLFYLKSNYEGYELNIVLNDDNTLFDDYIKNKAILENDSYDMRHLSKQGFVEENNVYLISEQYYKDYIQLSDELHPGCFWNAEKVLKTRNKFDVYIFIKDEKLLGFITVTNYFKPFDEIFALGVRKEYLHKNIEEALIKKVVNVNVSKDTDTMLIVEKSNKYEFDIFNKLKFEVVDTSKLYCLTL